MAEEYGKLPTEVLRGSGKLPEMDLFKIDRSIYRAKRQYEEDNKDTKNNKGPASSQQQNQMIQNQLNRAEQDGPDIPSQSAQMEALNAS